MCAACWLCKCAAANFINSCQISRPSPAAIAAAQDSRTTSTPSTSTLPAMMIHEPPTTNYLFSLTAVYIYPLVDIPLATTKHISAGELIPLTIMNAGLSLKAAASTQPAQSKITAQAKRMSTRWWVLEVQGRQYESLNITRPLQV